MADPNLPSANDKVNCDAINNEFTFDDLDLSFGDIFPPDANALNPNCFGFSCHGPNEGHVDPNGFGQPLISRIFKSSPELRHVSGAGQACDQSSSGSLVLSGSSENPGTDVSEYLDLPSPESNASSNSSGIVAQEIKVDELIRKDRNLSSILKRKKVSEDSENVSKYQKSDYVVESTSIVVSTSDEDGKRKARLMRNRESAQLSRQRKKHYVEELEDKVRTMHATIQDLNAKISYVMSENAGLRSQMGSTGLPQPVPHSAGPGMMYPPHPPVMYPWMPPYMVKPQGSHVPLVPIPRLKPQTSCTNSKKVENSNRTQMKVKKVASVSLLGLLFFMLLFGGLVPTVNTRYGGVKEPFTSSVYKERDQGRVLVVDGKLNGSSYSGKHDYGTQCDQRRDAEPNCSDALVDSPLMASLYVPRNDKLVKIDGNLIIHSVLSSEKAMTSHTSGDKKKSSGETGGLAVAGDLAPAIPGRQLQYRSPADGKRALGSGDEEKAKSTVQQWFLEGVAGPMLSSGMCTEVFQFDVSSAIVPSNIVRNVSVEQRQNATTTKGRNRRILNDLPTPVSGVSHNISEEHTGKKDDFTGNSSLSSMVVSVLVDPRETGDADVDGGMMGPKSISRVFVVVLIDSVKYVTYSCMLPFKGSVPLVTT